MEFNTLTLTLNNFIAAFHGGYARLAPAMHTLLGTLLGIELVLLGLYWALSGGEQWIQIIKKLMFLCFWIWLVQNFGQLASTFVDSLIKAGLIAGGKPGAISLLTDPSRIAGYGLDATEILLEKVQDIKWSIADAIIFGLSYIFIMAAFLIIAIQVFLTVLEYYLMLALVGIFVPFGILGQTKFLAEKAIGAVIASGVKLMVLAFIIAVCEPVLQNIKVTGPEIAFNEVWAVLLTAGSIAFLAWHAPGMAAGLLAGSPNLAAAHVSRNTIATSMVTQQMTSKMVGVTRQAALATGAAIGAASMVIGARMSSAARSRPASPSGGQAAPPSLVSSVMGPAGIKGQGSHSRTKDNFSNHSSSAQTNEQGEKSA